MAQLSLYINNQTLGKLQKAAKIEKTSVSRWVVKKLNIFLEQGWPDNYFDLFGDIDDKTFKKHKISNYSKDIKRVSL